MLDVRPTSFNFYFPSSPRSNANFKGVSLFSSVVCSLENGIIVTLKSELNECMTGFDIWNRKIHHTVTIV